MKWISVKDELPTIEDDMKDFLIVSFGEVIPAEWNYFAFKNDGDGHSHDGREFMVRNSDSDYGGLFIAGEVTHYMKFPKPPESEL